MVRRVVVVTGASSGIGRAVADAFAARGDRLVLAARGQDDLVATAAACRALGADVLIMSTDVTRDNQVDALVRAAVARFGGIDVWVNTAAVMAYGRFEDLPVEVFDRMIATDLLGAARVARAALREFRRQGTGVLILFSSLLGHVTVPYMSAYTTAKWGLRALARALQQETRDAPDIHVCLVSPGSVDTPIYTSAANFVGWVGRPVPPVDRADRVAATVLRLAERPRREASVGLGNGLIRFGYAFPPLYDALVGPLMDRLGLSRQFIEPTAGNVFRPRERTEGGPARWGRAAVGAAGAATAGMALGGGAWLLRRGRRA